MQIFLLRHANADVPAATDSERPLSDRGIAQAKKAGLFCRKHQLQPDLILISPLLRARQTAEHFAAQLDSVKMEVAPFLASGMEPETALSELKAYQNFERIFLVGHEPDFSMLGAHLLGIASEGNLHVRKASLSSFSMPVLRKGMATLEFSIPCALM